jgi:hypothetical protein
MKKRRSEKNKSPRRAPISAPSTSRELVGDPRRQAVASIQGTVYQAWASIEEWLRLGDADEVIYLEGAEDFDVIRGGNSVAVQVKKRASSISLGNRAAHDALENFWKLVTSNPGRSVDCHYLTTSPVAVEEDADFGDIPGIRAWNVARTDDGYAQRIADYLANRLPSQSALAAFLRTASPQEARRTLFDRFHWLVEQPSLEAVKRSVLERIVVRLQESGRPASLAQKVCLHLESRFWEIIVLPDAAARRLTLGDLLTQIESALTTYLPIPIHRVPDLLGGQTFGPGLLELLLDRTSAPPEPLLRRPKLVRTVRALVETRRAVLLTGSVYKGKTTIAQLLAAEFCPTAWWLKFTGRRADQVDTLLLALANRTEGMDCPALIILDDLDTTLSALNVFGTALQLLLHRADLGGRAVLITAQGRLDASFTPNMAGVVTMVIPELDETDISNLCVEFGCPLDLSLPWAKLISMWTQGHPKLVQVRIAELSHKGWPKLGIDDVLQASPAVTNARQLSRRLLSETQSEAVATFLYSAAELTVPMDRSLALLLASALPGIPNPGDVIDSLTGQWLERIGERLLRPTPLLKGAAADVWPKQRVQQMHATLHDVLVCKGTLDQLEAAAMFFHALMAGEQTRLGLAAARLQIAGTDEVQRAVFQQLVWLPGVYVGPGETFTNDPFLDATIRSLQFRVATLVDDEQLTKIAERWRESVLAIDREQPRLASAMMLWTAIGMCESPKLRLELRLQAAQGALELQDAPFEEVQILRNVSLGVPGVPENSRPAQLMFLMASRNIRGLDALITLVNWLEAATPALRAEFDTTLGWPLMQTMGAAVQTAWSAYHGDITDWGPWLAIFERIGRYAEDFDSPNFGREAAKAKAIILTEYLNRSDDALEALSVAEATFGQSVVLTEQKANVLFQSADDEGVLAICRRFKAGELSATLLDPFAYRRMGMSATRLGQFADAVEIFQEAIDRVPPGEYVQTRFGLQVDTALSTSLDGRHSQASRMLLHAVHGLPVDARQNADTRWEALQRTGSEYCRQIEGGWKKKPPSRKLLEPGYASSPNLRVDEAQPDQSTRSDLLFIDAVQLAASLGNPTDAAVGTRIRDLMNSTVPFVRIQASQANLAVAMTRGPAGFISALTHFDRSVHEMGNLKRESLLQPDSKVGDRSSGAPQRWLGLLVGSLICSDRPAVQSLAVWQEECAAGGSEMGEIAGVINQALVQLKNPNYDPRDIVFAAAMPIVPRSVAALALLASKQPAKRVAELECLLASALVSDGSYIFLSLLNRHIATRFATIWRQQVEDGFGLVRPRVHGPLLEKVADRLPEGTATLLDWLGASCDAVGLTRGEFFTRVW